MLVKPAPGLKVRDPVKKDFLPETGRTVSDTDLYWNRRLRDGDVVLATPEAVVVAKSAAIKTAPAVEMGGDKV
jgi:hypothetical protein